jgi:hypothetical protein
MLRTAALLLHRENMRGARAACIDHETLQRPAMSCPAQSSCTAALVARETMTFVMLFP